LEKVMDAASLDVRELIEKTKHRQPLSADELGAFITGYVEGTTPDYQVAAWLMAACLQGLTATETVALTDALVNSGQRIDLRSLGLHAVDKHSTGGIGDKTSLVLVPLVAAGGLTVAKMSGRGLGFTGGTLDKLESVPGLRVDLTIPNFLAQAQRIGLVIAGQTADLAPGDGKLYALRDVTATVDSIPLIAASIMSKKIAAGASSVILDVKMGGGAFIEQPERARELAATMIGLGRAAGLHMAAALSWMDQPLGLAIGNALELREAIDTLQGHGPDDLRELCLRLGTELLLLAGKSATPVNARQRLEHALSTGAALNALRSMVHAQGGDAHVLDDPARLPQAPVRQTVLASRAGFVTAIDARSLGYATVRLGAGRAHKGDVIDHATGFVLHAKVGTAVAAGEALATVHARTAASATDGARAVSAAYTLGDAAPPTRPVVEEVMR
jgi:pyrimidine-nucleoside phosphorylase